MESVQLELDLGLDQGSPSSPSAAPSERLIVDRNRPVLLRALYERDGRDNPDHPLHGVYTGLAVELHRAVGQALVDKLLGVPGFSPEIVLGHWQG
jgi:hypothetical protein